MLPPIFIDLSQVVNEFVFDEGESKALQSYVLSNVADEYMRYWESNIDNSLNSTRAEYRQAIFTEKPDDSSIVFGMTPRQSKLAMMLEDGASEFDIKQGFSKSTKKKTKADGGWYLTIPFRHATSEAIAESMVFSSRMPKEIEKLVKTVDRPLNLSDLPKGYREVRTSRVGYKHKAPIYEGLHRRDISSSEKENRGGYFTFRRVSDKSEDNSWTHKGFKPLNLMEKSLNEMPIDTIVDRSIDEFLKAKLGI